MAEHNTELSGWLYNGWKEEYPIAVVEGFSGIGKTSAALQYMRGWSKAAVLVTLPSSLLYEDLLFTIVSGLEDAGLHEVADATDWEQALLAIIASGKLLLVLDNLETQLDVEGVVISAELRQLLTRISILHHGRTCILTSRSPAQDSWTEHAVFRTVRQLGSDEGSRILSTLLRERELTDEVADDLLAEVSSWLGNNPRAMRAFVACLMGESLDEIIERDKDSWELRNTPRSRQLIGKLEKDFWFKTIGRLDSEAVVLAENLSVFRRPFRADAIQAAGSSNSAWEGARNRLSRSFLLDRSQAWWELNPIVRQLCATTLAQNTRRLTAAHARAADHFAHRIDPRAYRDEARSGAAFVEARYHYLQAGRPDRVDELAKQYRGFLLRAYRGLDLDLLDVRNARDRIPVLLAALDHDDPGYGLLRASLVQLLEARGSEGDDVVALHQALLASRERTPLRFWKSYVTIASRQESDQFLVTLASRALDRCVEAPEAIIVRIAHTLFRRGNLSDAHRVLDESRARLHGEPVFYLVRMKSFLFDRGDRFEEAFAISLDSHRTEPRTRLGDRLIEELAFLAYQHESVSKLDEIVSYATSLEPPSTRLTGALAQILIAMLQGDFARAVAIGAPSTSDPAIACQVAFCKLVLGDVAGAALLVRRLGSRNSAAYWLNAVIALCAGDADTYLDAIERSYAEALGVPVGKIGPGDEALEEKYWLKVWDQVPADLRTYPAYYFPRLPAQLTGLDRDLVRTYRGGSLAGTISESNPALPTIFREVAVVPDALAVRESSSGLPFIYVQEGSFEVTADKYINSGQAGVMGKKTTVLGDVRQTQAPVISVSDSLQSLIVYARSAGDDDVAEVLTATLELESAADHIGAMARFKSAAHWVGDKLSDTAVAVAAGVVLGALTTH